MSIKPVETLTMASKSWEASTQNVNRIQKEALNQAQLYNEYGKEKKHDSKQTVKLTKTEQEDYRYDRNALEDMIYDPRKKKKKKKQDKNVVMKEEEATAKPEVHPSIDIRI